MDIQREIVYLLPRLKRFARHLSGSEDAEDIVQAACLRALSRLEQFTPGTRLDSWMFRIVQTVWIDHARGVQRRRRLNDSVLVETFNGAAEVHAHAEARSVVTFIESEIAGLPEPQRVTVTLIALDGLTYGQAADAMGVPVGTVMSRLARARRKLGHAMDGFDGKKSA